MQLFHTIKKTGLLLSATVIFATACNKVNVDPIPGTPDAQGTTPTLATLLDDPNYSFFKAAVQKAGLLGNLSVPTLRYTVFAPDNAAFTLSTTPFGLPPLSFIAFLDTPTVRNIVSYHIVPQKIVAASIPDSFPNFQYPTLLNPLASNPAAALFRVTTFPSKRGNAAWVNNVPLTGVDMQAVNGVLHSIAAVVLPPGRFLWDVNPSVPPLNVNNSIFNAPDLTYFKAAVLRADSGVAVGARLVDALTNIGANLTILAPVDTAMRSFLTVSITQGLIPLVTQYLISLGYTPAAAAAAAPTVAAGQAAGLAATPDVFSNPQLFGSLTPELVKGILAYHILSNQKSPYAPPGIRVFSVNFPTSSKLVKTLLNSAPIAALHPGVALEATFTGPFVTAATVKGLVNPTASKVIINPANPFATDAHFLNGNIIRIDQVLRPQ